MRDPIDHILHQVNPIQGFVQLHVKGRPDRALFLVTPDVQVASGQAVDQPRASVKTKDDGLLSVRSTKDEATEPEGFSQKRLTLLTECGTGLPIGSPVSIHPHSASGISGEMPNKMTVSGRVAVVA